jgi:phosphoglucomutase
MGVYDSDKANAEKSFEMIKGQVEDYVKSKLN